MKRFSSFLVATVITLTAAAQNIAVVSPSNNTTIYHSLDEAITEAAAGSVIYLPGGGVTVKDETKITKKLTIMGVSHRGDTDNAEGASLVGGTLRLDKGADGTALMGFRLSGNIEIGTSSDSVRNVLVRYCNVNSIQVKHSQCSGLVVNQCYLRSGSQFKYCNANITNSICYYLYYLTGAVIKNNILTGNRQDGGQWGEICALRYLSSCIITDNVFLNSPNFDNGTNCDIYRNMSRGEYGDDAVKIDADWSEVFVKDAGVSTNSDYHFTAAYKQYSDIGIYGGTGFSDEALAPIPRIVSKEVSEQTDGTGKLKVEVTVKAQ